jgi:ketosteroid isomerase-like protein
LTQRADIERTLAAYFDGMNSERYDQVAALFRPDARLKAPGTEWVQGTAAVEGYYRAALGPYPDHRDEPTRTIIADAVATVEIHFKGALASGIPLEFDAVDVFDFDDDGRITKLTSWYDSHEVRSQLRAARAAAGDRGRG